MSNYDPNEQETPEETLRRLQEGSGRERPELQDPYGATPPPPPPANDYNPYLQAPSEPDESPSGEAPYGGTQPGEEADPYQGYLPQGSPPPYSGGYYGGAAGGGDSYGNGGYGMGNPPEHPSATSWMIMGIIGILCCNLISPVVFVLANKAKREAEQTGSYSTGGALQTAWILGLVGTAFFGLLLIYFMVTVVAAVGSV